MTEDTFSVEVLSFSESDANQVIGVGFFSIARALPLKSKPTITVDLYFKGKTVGNVILDLEFQTEEIEKYIG